MRQFVIIAGVLGAIALAFLMFSGLGEDPLVRRAKDAVRAQLNDPESAKFINVALCDQPGGVQGEVNAKNAFGGYPGARQFFYIDGSLRIANDDNRNAIEHMRRACYSDEVMAEIDKVRNEHESAINSM